MPAEWSRGAIVKKVPMQPLFDESSWKQYLADPRLDLKPGPSIRPEHWALKLPALKPRGISLDHEDEYDVGIPQIRVHEADQWATVYTDGKAQANAPALTLRGLRKQIEDWFIKDDTYGTPDAFNGSLTFICLKKQLRFKGGVGIRMVCQRTIEPDLVRRGELHYMFLGMSDDDSYHIIATFPLDHPVLPGRYDKASHLGWSTERYEELSKDFNGYEKAAKRWIVDHEKEFTPGLSALDAMMQSLQAAHWS